MCLYHKNKNILYVSNTGNNIIKSEIRGFGEIKKFWFWDSSLQSSMHDVSYLIIVRHFRVLKVKSFY